MSCGTFAPTSTIRLTSGLKAVTLIDLTRDVSRPSLRFRYLDGMKHLHKPPDAHA